MAENERARLRALIEEFHSGMLVTRTLEGTMRSRPMAVAQLAPNDDIFFATSRDTAKVDEIEQDHQVAVTFQSANAYVSVSGPVRMVTDRAKIDEVWNESMKVWFPRGKDDPALCLLQLRPIQAEFWNMQGLKGLRYIFEAAKAYATGTTPTPAPGQHGEIGMPHV